MARLVQARNKRATCIYGMSKSAKTALASLHPRPPGSKIAYICPDPGALGLDSFLLEDRDAVDVFLPDGNFDAAHLDKLNWRVEAYDLAQQPWDSQKYGLIIVDHGTVWCEEFLKESARLNSFSDKGAVTGTNNPKHEAGKKYAVAQPGDYMIAQNLLVEVVNNFIRQQDIPQVWIFQETFDSDLKWFGPKAAGQRGPGILPNLFGTTLWCSREVSKENPDGDLQVHLTNREGHIAGAGAPADRAGQVPPFKILKKGDLAGMRAFWTWLQEVKGFKS